MARRGKYTSPVTQSFPREQRERVRVEFLSGVALVAFLSLIGAVFCLSNAQRYVMGSSNVASVVSAVLTNLANQDRADNGLSSLAVNPVLVAAAQAKANDMAAKSYFAHVSPDGVDPWHWFAEAGYSYQYAGENLAIDFSDSADVNAAWMNSPTHRANILGEHFTEVGIAMAQGTYEGRATTFVVEEFGAPVQSVVPAPVQQTSDPSDPTVIAISVAASSTGRDSRVLGLASTSASSVASTTDVSTAQPIIADMPVVARVSPVPVWGYLFAFPREAIRVVYLWLAVFVLGALAYETELEIHARHRQRALVAGGLLLLIIVLFVVVDNLVFVAPIVTT